MMTDNELKQILLASFPEATINVSGEDANYTVNIISPEFENVSKLNRQKKILSCVKALITSGEIHAFSIQAYTQEEYQHVNSLKVI